MINYTLSLPEFYFGAKTIPKCGRCGTSFISYKFISFLITVPNVQEQKSNLQSEILQVNFAFLKGTIDNRYHWFLMS